MTQETNGALLQFGDQYLVAVYVKFVESAGARAAPILYPLNLTFVLMRGTTRRQCLLQKKVYLTFYIKWSIYISMTLAGTGEIYTRSQIYNHTAR